MRNLLRILLIMTLFVLSTSVVFAENDIIINKNAAKVFASLPDGVAFPCSWQLGTFVHMSTIMTIKSLCQD